MFNTKTLTPQDIEKIHQWISQGADMSELQAKLKQELGHNLTYMDTRFLALDLDLQFPEKESTEEEPPPHDQLAAPTPELTPEPTPNGSSISLTIDQLTRPGALVSGTVTFSDSQKALWLIDEMGRPSIDPHTPGYQPTEADLIQFQNTLRKQLEEKESSQY